MEFEQQISEEENIHKQRYIEFIKSRPKRIYIKKSGLVKHHIVPRCLNGSNDSENIIVLTVREHYIAHLILWKAYGSKMSRAFWLISNMNLKLISSRQYELLKKDIFLSEETRQKMSKSKKGKNAHARMTEEQKKIKSEKMSQSMKKFHETHDHPRGNLGNKYSEETKKRMSENNKGLIKSEETKRKLSEAHKGKKLSEAHKILLSIRATNKFVSDKTKKKMREAAKNRPPISEDTRKKLSIAAKLREETKKKNKESTKKETMLQEEK